MKQTQLIVETMPALGRATACLLLDRSLPPCPLSFSGQPNAEEPLSGCGWVPPVEGTGGRRRGWGKSGSGSLPLSASDGILFILVVASSPPQQEMCKSPTRYGASPRSSHWSSIWFWASPEAGYVFLPWPYLCLSQHLVSQIFQYPHNPLTIMSFCLKGRALILDWTFPNTNNILTKGFLASY